MNLHLADLRLHLADPLQNEFGGTHTVDMSDPTAVFTDMALMPFGMLDVSSFQVISTFRAVDGIGTLALTEVGKHIPQAQTHTDDHRQDEEEKYQESNHLTLV